MLTNHADPMKPWSWSTPMHNAYVPSSRCLVEHHHRVLFCHTAKEGFEMQIEALVVFASSPCFFESFHRRLQEFARVRNCLPMAKLLRVTLVSRSGAPILEGSKRIPGCVVKNRYPNWNPSKWKHGPKPAVPWFNFDPYPKGNQPPAAIVEMAPIVGTWTWRTASLPSFLRGEGRAKPPRNGKGNGMPHMGMGQNYTTRGPQVLVHVSTY